jgi:pyruvate formate lyase activating enzyme
MHWLFQMCRGLPRHGAVKKYGYQLSVADLLQEINKDEIFYYHSGGGVTISGGEPLSQPLFTLNLRECKKIGIHTAIESSFHRTSKILKRAFPGWITLCRHQAYGFDGMHQDWVGEGNSQILENIKRVDQSNYPLEIIIRIPLIPGYNDSDQNLGDT